MRAFPFIVLALVILAAIAGWLATPHYRKPADSGEARLKERAVEFYRASRLIDYGGMCRLFTPARQETEADQLRKDISEKRDEFAAMGEVTKQDLRHSAESISADKIIVKAEGDWAVTSGSYQIEGESGPLTVPLPDIVWVRNAGDWWVYSLKNEELNAYGNPPDFARDKLELRTPLMVEQTKQPSQ